MTDTLGMGALFTSKRFYSLCLQILLSIGFFSCGDELTVSRLDQGICIKEINTRYVASGKDQTHVYKILKIKKNSYEVGMFKERGKGIFYLSSKPFDYFESKNSFKYELTDCPDGSGPKKSLQEQMKESGKKK